jgi:hypothetical protein
MMRALDPELNRLGIDALYQPFPSSPLLSWAMADRHVAEYLPFFAKYAAEPLGGHSLDPLTIEFAQKAKELALRDPSLAKREVRLFRMWDALYYLLSPERRTNIEKPRDFGDPIVQAIFGAEQFPWVDPVEGLLRITPPHATRTIAENLAHFTPDELRASYDPSAMIAAGVYKVHKNDSLEELIHLVDGFASLRRMYEAAAEREEYVIVSMG